MIRDFYFFLTFSSLRNADYIDIETFRGSILEKNLQGSYCMLLKNNYLACAFQKPISFGKAKIIKEVNMKLGFFLEGATEHRDVEDDEILFIFDEKEYKEITYFEPAFVYYPY